MSTIDTSFYYLIESAFVPGFCLAAAPAPADADAAGTYVKLVPPATALAQLWTELWAFKPSGSNYVIRNMSGGSANILSNVGDHGAVALATTQTTWSILDQPAGTIFAGSVILSANMFDGLNVSGWGVNLSISQTGPDVFYATLATVPSFLQFFKLSKTAVAA